MKSISTFLPPTPYKPFQQFMVYMNRYVLSKDMTWIVDEESLENWKSVPKGAALFVAAKHAHYSDEYSVYEMASRVGTRCLFVSISEIFENFWGLATPFMRMLGVIPVERGGRNVQATRFIVDAFVRAEFPIAIFPEGELFYLNDVVTPLKRGTAFFALEGAKARSHAGKSQGTYILPFALKYVYPYDITSLLADKLSNLERKLSGKAGKGEIIPRIHELLKGILLEAETRFDLSLEGKTSDERFLCLSRKLVEKFEKEEDMKGFSGDLSDRARRFVTRFASNKKDERFVTAFWALHSLAFMPGYLDYPSQERLMETLRKSERLITGRENPHFPGRKLLLVKIQKAVCVESYLSRYLEPKGKRGAMEQLLSDLRSSMQESVDALCRKAKDFSQRKTAAMEV